MIVIDVSAERKLIQLLEALRIDPDATSSIHCKFSQNHEHLTSIAMNHERVIRLVELHLAKVMPQVYFCDDGDMFILSPSMEMRDAHHLMLDIAEIFKTPVTDDFMELCEVNRHANRLVLMMQDKIEKKRQREEAAQHAQAKEQIERKRQAILNSEAHSGLRDIGVRRHARETAELMLIEDDAFSRRLVENALGKKYTMTSLATADEALATYARLAPDLLFLDINLPDVSGHELLAKIVALDPDAHVVMLSANSDRDNIDRALGMGAKGFVAKPFTREKLFQYIQRCPTIPATPAHIL